MAFSILDTLPSIEKSDAPSITMIELEKLKPHKDNFYDVSENEKNQELMASIKTFGVLEPLIVKDNGDDTYTIIGGERRYAMSKQLAADGEARFNTLPCIISKIEDNNSVIATALEQLKLIHLNSTSRVLKGWEMTEQISRIKAELSKLKENGYDIGDMRNAIVDCTGISRTQVGVHEQIANNLGDEFRQEYQSGNISTKAAAELSKMSPSDQKAVYEKTGGTITAEQAKEMREEGLNEKELESRGQGKIFEPCEESEFYDQYGRTKVNKFNSIQNYKEHDEVIDIKDDRLTEGGYRIYLVQDKEDNHWRSSVGTGFVEVGAGRWPMRNSKNPLNDYLYPAYKTRAEALKRAISVMLTRQNKKDIEILHSLGYGNEASQDNKPIEPGTNDFNEVIDNKIRRDAYIELYRHLQGRIKMYASFAPTKVEVYGEVLEFVQAKLYELTHDKKYKLNQALN